MLFWYQLRCLMLFRSLRFWGVRPANHESFSFTPVLLLGFSPAWAGVVESALGVRWTYPLSRPKAVATAVGKTGF